jgi:glyoxylase-like metal-dependent hydrolase (beta-lactamase superfamily II)
MWWIGIGAALAANPIVDGQQIGPLIQVQEGFTSLYLLDHGDGTASLFDVGTTPTATAAVQALATRGLDVADVTDIFVTHGHTDHVAGLGRFPGARIHASSAERPLLASVGFTVTDPHIDGDIVSVGGGYTVEIFEVPGHTAGSAIYFVDGVLLMGDTVTAEGRNLEPIWPFFSDNPAQNRASLLDLRDEFIPRRGEILWFAPSHSAPLRGPGQRAP